jgi:hypothetical protein
MSVDVSARERRDLDDAYRTAHGRSLIKENGTSLTTKELAKILPSL